MAVAAAIALATTATGGRAQDAVSPSDRRTFEGVTSTTYPLGRRDARVQTLHSDLPAGMVLAGHAYRRDGDGSGGSVAAYSIDMEVRLSMSPRTPATASRTFADNANAANEVTVVPRAVLSFPATTNPGTGPAPAFELVVPYSRPFTVAATGGTVCVDTTIRGNNAPSGANRNFSPYLDAHRVVGDGTNQTPGLAYGQGCAPRGATTLSTCAVDVDLGATDWSLEIDLRDGVPGDGNGRAVAVMIIGSAMGTRPWPNRPACVRLTSGEFWTQLAGEPDANGDWRGSLDNLPLLPPGTRLFVQGGSFDLVAETLVLTNGSTIDLPGAGPTSQTTARVAAGSDHTSPTGTVSSSVPVMRFF